MIFDAARYAYPNAKVRALRSRRLTAQDRHFLLEAKDFSSFLAYLVTTTYGRALSDLEEEKTDPGVLERRLARSLIVLPQFILPAKSRDKIPVKRVGSTILSFPAIGLKKHLIISSQYRPLDNNLCGHGSGNFVRGCA